MGYVEFCQTERERAFCENSVTRILCGILQSLSQDPVHKMGKLGPDDCIDTYWVKLSLS